MIEFKTLKRDLLNLLIKSFNRVLVEKTVERDGKTFIQHFWVSPDEVKHNDKVRYNRHLLSKDHPQRHKANDDITDYHEFTSEEDIENILGGLISDDDMPFTKWLNHRVLGEKRAIKEYTGGPCKAINGYLRGTYKVEDALANKDEYWDTNMLKKIIPVIPYLDKTIARFETPVPLRVHRVVSIDMLQTFVDAQNSKDGIFVEDGYCSTSLLEGSFGDEETDITMVIDVPPGVGIGAYLDPVSEYGGEYEFLMARGTMFKIHSITPATKDHGPVVHMEAVGRKENINVMTPEQLSEQLLHLQLQRFGLRTKKSTLFMDLLKALGKDNPTKVLVAQTVSREGKTFIQHFWVSPDEVKHDDKVVVNYQNLPDNHPQKYQKLSFVDEAYDLLGDWEDDSKPFGKWKQQLSRDDEMALGEYTEDSHPMNHYLREDAPNLYKTLEEVELDRERMEKAINEFEIPEPLTVYRRVGLHMLEQIEQAQKAGGIFKDSAFCSTAVINGSFGNPKDLQMIIRVPAGKGIGAWLAPLSEFPEENELLLNHGTLFEIHNITPATDKRGPIVEMTVVGRDPSHP